MHSKTKIISIWSWITCRVETCDTISLCIKSLMKRKLVKLNKVNLFSVLHCMHLTGFETCTCVPYRIGI